MQHITTKKIILLSGYRNNFEAMSVVSACRKVFKKLKPVELFTNT